MFSMLQFSSQPFPTPPAPASHSSEACFIPSPHTAIHSEDSVFGCAPKGVQCVHSSAPVVDPPLHAHPASMLQSASHPSPGSVSPSSQASEGCLNPFPHDEIH